MVEPPAEAGDCKDAKEIERDEDAPAAILTDDETENLVENYIKIREKVTDLEKIKKAIYAQLLIKMGTATQALQVCVL